MDLPLGLLLSKKKPKKKKNLENLPETSIANNYYRIILTTS